MRTKHDETQQFTRISWLCYIRWNLVTTGNNTQSNKGRIKDNTKDKQNK